eukprot:TRINITY_DN17507_c0_g1_i1.p1 TRINITY_DN17507_c0_g1~~TRINITY_DN17507_c0_g1_i1.p1  ORF type:complete len:1169 (-),score=322.64 TRINITY_DN17507_c0_g1_i1:37-3264(-)
MVRVKVMQVTMGLPTKQGGERLLPVECRQGSSTYSVPGTIKVQLKHPNFGKQTFSVSAGRIPIMVGCDSCWLNIKHATPQQCVEAKEDDNELGGYFITNGLEKLVRMLIYQRPNHPITINRPSWCNKGPNYTKHGCLIRCMRTDSTTQTNTAHYMNNGGVTVRFIFRRQEFFIPALVLLKALGGVSDREIYDQLTMRDPTNTHLTAAAEMLLRAQSGANDLPAFANSKQALEFIGSRFRVMLMWADKSMSDEQVGRKLIERFILVHLESDSDKRNLLIFMIQKLFALASGDIEEDNVDSPMFHSLLLSGHLYLTIFKDLLQDWLYVLRQFVMKDALSHHKVELSNPDYIKNHIETHVFELGNKLEYFLATGNHNSKSGVDLMQKTGFALVADKINFVRWLSHFQSVHRGSFYAEMKTTAIRKLLPESWGFFCPVHTPDGAPCGLLNHLAIGCRIIPEPLDASDIKIEKFMVQQGMSPIGTSILPPSCVPVLLNGRVIGRILAVRARLACDALRLAKIKQLYEIPYHTEIAYIDGRLGNGYQAIYLSTDMSRMIRPVLHTPTKLVEWVGVLEQVFMDIACGLDNAEPLLLADAPHREIAPTNMLSMLGNQTPFSDMNQSPRNMYQCQMAKHTMGTPCHNGANRNDVKLSTLNYVQKPMCVTKYQDTYSLTDYAQGLNGILAVISYTGYDMEDAFIMNKSSVERGFMHGTMTKSYRVNLDKDRKFENRCYSIAHDGLGPDAESIERDGLPQPGEHLRAGSPLYSVLDTVSGEVITKRTKGEDAVVDSVRLIGTSTGSGSTGGRNRTGAAEEGARRHAVVKVRYNRNPVVGDKFAARHGQKGVLSQLWPERDMPFSESGMTPDCIINPHAFPSRMTIGMLVECVAGKAGALHGMHQDATPFRYDEKNMAVHYFGEQLLKAGYNYYGNEPLYSGITGEAFTADVFFGPVYYQRLVHQVKDKYQVRALGPVNDLTQQPVHGRKRGGGIRFGEMERDSILGHGTSLLLHDRLFNCSDKSFTFVCAKCGCINTPMPDVDRGDASCPRCKTRDYIKQMYIPFVFRYLSVELAAMNIRVSLDVN